MDNSRHTTRASGEQMPRQAKLLGRLIAAPVALVVLLVSCDVNNLATPGNPAFLAAVQQGSATPSPGSTPAPPGSGAFCPVPGSTFTDTWGAPRSGGRSHEGVDMMAPAGTPVHSPVAGNVRHHVSSSGGLSYYLEDAAGNVYFGTHLQSFGADGAVQAGTVIGYVGSSGNASANAPHLHFEYHPGDNGPINPTPFARAACGV